MTENKKPPIQIFFVDNKEQNLKVLESRFVRELGKLGSEVEFVFEADADSACETIFRRGSHDAFPVVMADLLFFSSDTGEEDDPRGIDVIKEARSSSRQTVIVALTGGSPHYHPNLEREAREAGADTVLRRRQLLGEGTQELIQEIYRLLCERDLVRAGPYIEIPDEPGIQSIIYDAGKATLRLLLGDIFARRELQPERVAVGYVTPGASGARIVRAQATLMDGSLRQLLVKLNRDRDALLNEQQNYERSAGRYDPGLLVPSLGVAGPRNEWSALAVWFARDVVTLREWIVRPRSVGTGPGIMDRLFLSGGLSEGYRDRVKAPEGETPIRRLGLPPFRRVLVRTAVEELVPVLSEPAIGATAEASAVVRVIEGFARDGRLDNLPPSETPRDLLLCLGHGDLHGGNVLVSKVHHSPMLVDMANWGPQHWAGDVARLCVDLFMWGFDSGVVAFFWERFPIWREVGRLLGNLEPSIEDERSENATTVEILNWIGVHKFELLPPLEDEDRVWEWHVALAEQLLRRTYDKDMPPTKRTFAMLAAYDQLMAASRRVPRAKPTFLLSSSVCTLYVGRLSGELSKATGIIGMLSAEFGPMPDVLDYRHCVGTERASVRRKGTEIYLCKHMQAGH